jgi:uncharacterized ion transporter superfamily protein YfcC
MPASLRMLVAGSRQKATKISGERRRVNFRGTSLFSQQGERRKKMKRLMIVLSVLFVFSISAFAEMSTRQGGGMMRGGWWWGMYSGWFFMIIIAILIIGGIFLIMKRR